jgi:hypothetical protein
MTAPRFWITDPRGHRLYEEEHKPEDGSLIDTVFGEAVVIRPPLPPGDLWVCDLCNEEILTRFGGEPWPVPMFGGYALCHDHLVEAMEWPEEDNRTGAEIVGTRLGPWPLHVCACPPCVHKATDWLGNLWSDHLES